MTASDSTMASPSIIDVMDIVPEGVDGETLLAIVERFMYTTFFVPAQDSPSEGLRMRVLDDGTEEIGAFVEREVGEREVASEGLSLWTLTGEKILALAQLRRMDLALIDADRELHIRHKALLLLHKASALLDGAGASVQPLSTVDAACYYPHSFVRWLEGWCRVHADVSKVWLALLLDASKAVPDVCVLFDKSAPSALRAQVLERTEGLLPNQLVLSKVGRLRLDDGRDAEDCIRALTPLYDKTQPQGWWARRKRHRHRPIAILRLEVIDSNG